ncbi:hypothetical protein Tco_1253573 [Tanacetum coccineum]
MPLTPYPPLTALTKQFEALKYHIASMRETYDQNQEAPIQLMQMEEELEPKTITKVMEIASSQSKPLVPPPETPPLIDIVDSLCDKFPIKNNSLSGNPTPSSDSVVESLSPSPTPCGDNYETFCFDIEEKSNGSTTSHSNHSLPEYESFCFDVDHIEEKSSGSTTTHSDLSLLEYESFHFDLSIDLFPPSDRSDSHHEEFADELAHIISPPEYERFYFDLEIVLRDFTIVLKENIFETSTKDFTIHELNDFPPLLSDCDSIFSKEFSEIDILVSLPFGNKDEVFDPRIFIIKSPI